MWVAAGLACCHAARREMQEKQAPAEVDDHISSTTVQAANATWRSTWMDNGWSAASAATGRVLAASRIKMHLTSTCAESRPWSGLGQGRLRRCGGVLWGPLHLSFTRRKCVEIAKTCVAGGHQTDLGLDHAGCRRMPHPSALDCHRASRQTSGLKSTTAREDAEAAPRHG